MKNRKELENAPKVSRRPTDQEEDEADLLHRRRVVSTSGQILVLHKLSKILFCMYPYSDHVISTIFGGTKVHKGLCTEVLFNKNV